MPILFLPKRSISHRDDVASLVMLSLERSERAASECITNRKFSNGIGRKTPRQIVVLFLLGAPWRWLVDNVGPEDH